MPKEFKTKNSKEIKPIFSKRDKNLIILLMIAFCLFVIGVFILIDYSEKESEQNQTDDILRIYEDSLINFNTTTIKRNCSEYYNYSAIGKERYEFELDTFEMIGCILTELHKEYPNKTDEVLEKYNIIVMYDGFELNHYQERKYEKRI